MTCKQIREAIIEGENEQAVQIAKSLVNAGVNSEEIIIDGVTKAMEYLDEKCTIKEFCLLELMLAGRAAMDVIDYLYDQGRKKGDTLRRSGPYQREELVLGDNRIGMVLRSKGGTIMSNKKNLSRRDALGLMAVAGIAGFAGLRAAQVNAKSIGAMMPGKGWLKQGTRCEGDGTPLQFIPKTAPDPDPLTDELKKYPKCPYCGMDRTMWNHSRHLVHYDDDLVDGTCSIHCLAISLALNLDRGIRAIYAADFGAADKPKPLINVDKATYLIGSSLKGTMTKKSKMALASAEKARAVQAKEGGELGRFDDALRESYLSMANDTMMIRQRRADKRKKMMMKKKVK